MTRLRGAINALMTTKLREKGEAYTEQVVAAYAKMTKADDDIDAKVEAMIAAITVDWKDVMDEIAPLLAEVAKDGVAAAAEQLSVAVGVSLDQPNERAIEYANKRSAEMIGMRRKGDELVPNPNAKWAITESTRNMIRADVVGAMEEGWSTDKLADTLQTNYAFSAERAASIARTETAMADVEGNVMAYLEAENEGVTVLKKWVTAGDDKVSEDCMMNGRSKPLPLKAMFPSGVQNPPEHPRCRCDVVPIVREND